MDRLAACHFMNGFFPSTGSGSNRRRHTTAPNCQHVKTVSRSLSLLDRRGIISPSKADHRGLVSTAPRFCGDYAEAHSMRKLHDMSMVMKAMNLNNHMSTEELMGDMPMRPMPMEGSTASGTSDRKPSSCVRSYPYSARRSDNFGELMVTLCYLPRINKIVASVVKACDFSNCDKNFDPYLRLWLAKKGDEWEKRGTSVVSQNMVPTYNESFTFNVPPKETLKKEVNLVISVMDMLRNEVVDHVVIGLMSGAESGGARQWLNAIEHAEKPFTVWYKLPSSSAAGW